MSDAAVFESVSAYQEDVLGLPVSNLDVASEWYCKHFGLTEVERREDPLPTVVLERDGQQIGFAINGGDPEQDGAAIRVNDLDAIKTQLESTGTEVSDVRVDERDGKRFRVFFVVAPDGLCYYFHQAIDARE
ncbi:MAG: VOC family protein [Planctomycetota bacterium]